MSVLERMVFVLHGERCLCLSEVSVSERFPFREVCVLERSVSIWNVLHVHVKVKIKIFCVVIFLFTNVLHSVQYSLFCTTNFIYMYNT